ncbi:response regulator [Cellulomonas sp. 179-A 4D5 NHS]|uniref:response regulator n=1 Tax=Cellulomonas sp. 179-A 4D5 NHS TaxID=3142378 RepID=UPI0039A0835E
MTGLRVLVVDDEAVVRSWLRSALDAAGDGADLHEAVDCAQALKIVARARPDVVVVDDGLDDHHGIALCRRIRARRPDIALVLLTSFDDAVATRTVRLADADGYVLRDLRDGDLGQALRSAVSSRAGRTASPRLLT